MSASRFIRRHFHLLLGGVVLAAFLVRLVVCGEMLLNHPQASKPTPERDMATYDCLATRIAHLAFNEEFYYQPFYYAVFLAGMKAVCGESRIAQLVAQAALGAGAVLFAAGAAALMFGRRAGLLTALLAGLAKAPLFYTSFLLIETLQSFWLSLLLYLGVRCVKNNQLLHWALAGVVLGCAILTRGNMWLAVPVFLLFAWRGTFQARRARISLFLLLVVLPQLPFIAWNSCKKGRLCGPSTAAGAVLAFGNTPESPPAGNDPGAGPGLYYSPTQNHWMSTADKVSVRDRVLRFVATEPLAFAELTFRKLLLFWDRREIPNNLDINHEARRSLALTLLGIVSTGFLMALAIPGALLCLGMMRGRRTVAFSALFIVSFWVSVAAFYLLCRFRVPVIPCLAVFAAAFLDRLFFRLPPPPRRSRKLVVALLALGVGLVAAYTAYDGYRMGWEARVHRVVRPAGTLIDWDSRLSLMDNGPQILGAWDGAPLRAGSVIRKTFVIPRDVAPDGDAELILELACAGPVRSRLTVNGTAVELASDRTGGIEKTIPLSSWREGEVSITVDELRGELYGVFDHQRNYGRSAVDGVTLDGELVARLVMPKRSRGAP